MSGIALPTEFQDSPGLRLNVSRRSVGASVGPRGAKLSANTRGEARRTVGIPGTGISHTKTSRLRSLSAASAALALARAIGAGCGGVRRADAPLGDRRRNGTAPGPARVSAHMKTDVNAGPLAPENFRPRSRENVWQYRVLVDLSLLETTLADLGVLKRARLEKPDQQQDDDDYGKNAATDVHRFLLVPRSPDCGYPHARPPQT